MGVTSTRNSSKINLYRYFWPKSKIGFQKLRKGDWIHDVAAEGKTEEKFHMKMTKPVYPYFSYIDPELKDHLMSITRS